LTIDPASALYNTGTLNNNGTLANSGMITGAGTYAQNSARLKTAASWTVSYQYPSRHIRPTGRKPKSNKHRQQRYLHLFRGQRECRFLYQCRYFQGGGNDQSYTSGGSVEFVNSVPRPGNSPGMLNITGNYTQTSAGILESNWAA